MAQLSRSLAPFLTLPLLVACGGAHEPARSSQAPAPAPVPAGPSTPQLTSLAESRFLDPNVPSLAALHVDGAQIVDPAGQPVRLRGVAFGNEVWGNVAVPNKHHDEKDFERLHGLGMNTVRFYLNYLTFEDEAMPGVFKQSGWDWLDQNVAWARKNGVYLVLNMHAPPGGYQSLGKGVALWNEPKTQARYIALWRAIAERYASEGTIAGYDILNEPVPTKNRGQWKELAERTISAIREVDTKHIVFVERVNAVNGDWSEDADRNFFRVKDPNVVYEFHFYKPFHFTHQNAAWTDFSAREGKYPDASVAEVEWFLLDFKKEARSKSLPAGDSDWAAYETELYTVKDPAIVVGKPTLQCDHNAGTAYFDGLVLEKIERGKTEQVWERDLDTSRGWYYWTQDGSGKGTFTLEGHGDQSALSIAGTKGYANFGSDPLRFRTVQGASYRLRGYMKGKGISKEATCMIRLDFASSRGPVHARGKDFLKDELDAYVSWGKRENVPLFLGEWGTIRQSFASDYGGTRWVADMLDLIDERNLSYTYHAYHEENFGVFFGDGSLPDEKNANTALLEVFRSKLAPSAAKAVTPAPVAPAPAPAPAAPKPEAKR